MVAAHEGGRGLVAALAAVWTFSPACNPIPPPGLPARNATIGFHGDRARLGTYSEEPELTPAKVATVVQVWESAPFDTAVIGGVSFPPHVYGSPLYLVEVRITGGLFVDLRVNVVIAATSNGMLYAVAASGADAGAVHVDPGTILWRTPLGTPAIVPGHDAVAPAGVPAGVLGTPFIDIPSSRIYVVSNDAIAGWQAFAIDVASGTIISGWPIALNLGPSTAIAQRGALNLSTSGDRLYVPFGGYAGSGPGSMAAIDTRAAKLVTTFSSVPDSSAPSGGMWAPGGPAIDDTSRVFGMTGNASPTSHDAPKTWGNTLLAWNENLELAATYAPYNYCKLDEAGIDLGGSSPVVLPDLTATKTTTPHLVAFAGNGGTVYLLDRDHLNGGVEHRPACGIDPALDTSLLSVQKKPINVFGPDTDDTSAAVLSRVSTTPAYFKNDHDKHFLFVTGGSSTSLARLELVLTEGAPARLTVDAVETSLPFVNPGSPIVTSHGGIDPVVWVLDTNAGPSASLLEATTPSPMLYAIDGITMGVVWKTTLGALHVGGKNGAITVARGTVFVATDRINAFAAH